MHNNIINIVSFIKFIPKIVLKAKDKIPENSFIRNIVEKYKSIMLVIIYLRINIYV